MLPNTQIANRISGNVTVNNLDCSNGNLVINNKRFDNLYLKYVEIIISISGVLKCHNLQNAL